MHKCVRRQQLYAVSATDPVFKTLCSSLHTRRFTDVLTAIGPAIVINYCASRRLLINLTVKIVVMHFPAPLSYFACSFVCVCVC
jgi:hypothetical protein